MASLGLGIAGAYVGGLIGGPVGAQIGWAIGAAIGSRLDQKDQQGPRLEDLKTAGASYGQPIKLNYGTVRVNTEPIWMADLIEVETTESAKGGPEITTYSYYGDFAVMVCGGPIDGVRRIWANGVLIMDVSNGVQNTIRTEMLTGGFPTAVAAASYLQSPTPAIRIYLGTEDQQPDPLMESYLGVGNVPAYRDRVIVVFNRLALEQFGNRIPVIDCEIVNSGTFTLPPAEQITVSNEGGYFGAISTESNNILFTNNGLLVNIVDAVNDLLVDTITVDSSIGTTLGRPCWVPETHEWWLPNFDGPASSEPGVIIITEAGTVDSVSNSITGVAFFGFATYSADSGYVLLSTSDSTSGSRHCELIDPITRTLAVSPTVPWDQLHAAMSLDGAGMFAGCRGGGATENKRLVLLNAWSGDLVNSVELTGLTEASSPDQIAYDPLRRRVVIAPNSPDGYIYAVDIDTYQLTKVANSYSSTLLGMLYHPILDKIIMSRYIGGFTDFYIVNAETLLIEEELVGVGTYGHGYLIYAPDTVSYVWAGTENFGSSSRIYIEDRMDQASALLSAVVTDLCEHSQLTASDIDVTDLTDDVDGFVIGREVSLRQAIEQLASAYFFDGVESDGKIKFVKRGGSLAVTVDVSDLAAHDAGTNTPNALEQTRIADLELPNEVTIAYLERELDYAAGVQYAKRIVKPSGDIVKIEFSAVFTTTKARQIAEVQLYNAWTERTTFKFKVTWEYAYLEPTDVIQIDTGAVIYTMRLVQKTELGNGIIEFDAVAEDTTTYTQTETVGVDSTYVPQTIQQLQLTALRLMDIPLLRDVDDNAGFYQAANGAKANAGWPGAVLFSSVDNGVSYVNEATFIEGATIGIAQTALPDFLSGNIFDENSTLDIYLLAGSLSSDSEANVLAGANAAVLGDEIIQFKNATLIGTNIYRLSGLLRGRRGTEWAMSGHAAGEDFVLASTSAWRRLNHGTANWGMEYLYKAVTIGRLISTTPAIGFTNTGIGLKPYSPVEVGGGKDGNGDMIINWKRRTRISGEWRDYVDAALGEASESYEVDIISAGGAVRTIAATSETATYTAAQQATDFPSSWSKVGGDGVNSGWSNSNDANVWIYNVDGTIYATTRNNISNVAGIWKWTGSAWTHIAGSGSGVSGSWTSAERVTSLVNLNGELHCMIVQGGNYAECWRFTGGTTWEKIGGGATATNNSWSTATYFRIAHHAVVNNGKLYVGIGGASAGAGEVWEWDPVGSPTLWTKVGGDGQGWGTSEVYWCHDLCMYGDKLAVGNSYATGNADVWLYNFQANWEQIGGDGLNGGWAAATYETVYCLGTDGTYLYAGLGQTTGDAELWKYSPGSPAGTWEKIGGDGNGWAASTYQTVESLLVHSSGRIYAGLGQTTAGHAEVWEYDPVGSPTWNKIGGDGLNGSWANSVFELVQSMAEDSNGKIWVGLGNSAGDGDAYSIPDPSNPVDNPLEVEVYQLSALFGRGQKATGYVRY